VPVAKKIACSSGRKRSRQWTWVSLLLLASSALTGSLGPSLADLCSVVGLVALGLVVADWLQRNLPAHGSRGYPWKRLVLSLGFLGLGIVVLVGSGRLASPVLAIPLVLAALWVLEGREGEHHVKGSQGAVAIAVVWGVLLYSSLHLVKMTFPSFWLDMRNCTIAYTKVIGLLLHHPMAFGPSVAGSEVIAIYGFTALSGLACTRWKRWRRFVLCLGGLVLSQVLVVTVVGLVPYTIQSGGLLAMALGGIPLLFFLEGLERPVPRRSVWSPAKGCISASVAAIAVFGLLIQPAVAPQRARMAAVYLGDSIVTVDIPGFKLGGDTDTYTPVAGVSLGAMIELLYWDLGYEIRIVGDEGDLAEGEIPAWAEWVLGTLDAGSLEGCGVLVLTNISRPLTVGEIADIQEFVADGGALLVLADHTSMFVAPEDFAVGRDYFNELLLPTGLQLASDSAVSLGGNWRKRIAAVSHPISTPPRDEISWGISVGASVNVAGHAFPIAFGTYAFSDDPDPQVNGFLGDLEYETGELAGDVILVAGSTYGNGKVLVFGDTSGFQSSSIPRTYQLVEEAFRWLLTDPNTWVQWVKWAALGALLVCLASSFLSRTYSLALGASLVVAFVVGTLSAGALNAHWQAASIVRAPRDRRVAYIDSSHGERIDISGYKQDSVDGLIINFRRNGLRPYLARTSDWKLSNTEVLVLIAPTQRLTAREVDVLIEFAEQGGIVWCSAGWPDSHGLARLFAEAGVSLTNIPLGPVPYLGEEALDHVTEVRFCSAYPLVTTPDRDSRALYTFSIGDTRYDLVRFTAIGKGGILTIGDSSFLLNANLEEGYLPVGGWRHWPGNVRFVRDLIQVGRTQQP